jgi:hypothetical protein
MVSKADLFGFVQLELPGALGIADGRYPVRRSGGDADPEQVLIIRTLGAPRRHLMRGRRPRDAEAGSGPEPVPVTRVTAIRTGAFSDRGEASRWLEEAVSDSDRSSETVGEAVALLNRALHAHRSATHDPLVHETGEERATAVRIGYGTGDEVADGRWSEARELPRRPPRVRRREALMPQERLAALLGARTDENICETLLLRARLDLDQGRDRAAALQLRVGYEALLAEFGEGRAGAGQADDMATLDAMRSAVGDAANEALKGDLGPDASQNVADALNLCERVLRRRRILSG